MMGVKLQSIGMLLLLWLLPIIAALYLFARYKRQQALSRFAESRLLELINVSVSGPKRIWKALLLAAAFAFIILALARPAWNPIPKELEREGRDVVFMLDVSKSMLAEDLKPSRLERSKIAIIDVIDRLEGDRVGLVVFAGNSVVKCPLTLDYGFFRMMLSDISPGSVSKGGTMIGDAIRKTVEEVFDDQQKEYKDIILITDGEDHDSFPAEAAADAGSRGIRLIAIGLGDENQGQRIPVTDRRGRRIFLKHKGQEIWSRLDADTLRKMVNATPGGRYLNVATGTIDLGEVYQDLILSAEKKALESKTVKRYEEKFQIFLALAFILLCLEMLLNDRIKKRAEERI